MQCCEKLNAVNSMIVVFEEKFHGLKQRLDLIRQVQYLCSEMLKGFMLIYTLFLTKISYETLSVKIEKFLCK